MINRSTLLSTLFKGLMLIPIFAGGQVTVRANAEAVPVTAILDTEHPGAEISTNFSGLSFEASLLLPGENGVRYFRPDNAQLIQLFQTLGIRSLRIGGNTSDRNATQLPSGADWDSLFGFARAAGVKVVYCVRLYRGNPEVAARTVKYIMDHYAPWVDAFSIGQEPSAYLVSARNNDPTYDGSETPTEKCPFPAYARAWTQFAEAIEAAVPGAKFCGPDVHNDPKWTREFISSFGRTNHLAFVTAHLYPGGDGHKVAAPEIGRDAMLGPAFTTKYQKLYDGFVSAAAASGLPYRLTEVNSFYDGGATNVSNTFASALWGLDFMHWWAEHGAAGVNFHTGDYVAAGGALESSRYTAFVSAGDGFLVRPLGYAIKAFDLGGHGRTIPVTVSNPEKLNISIYAAVGPDQSVCATVINKETARPADLKLKLNHAGLAVVSMLELRAPGDDIAATNGQMLGGAAIHEDGSWRGKWTPLKSASQNLESDGTLEVKIAPASVEIIRITREHSFAR